MTIVIDASMAAAWFLPDEQNDSADKVLSDMRPAPGLVPSLFWFETRQLFLKAERRGRLRSGEAALSMAQLRRMGLHDEGTGDDPAVLGLAARRDLSGYDASYLSLALMRNFPLATLDRKLAAAARAEGVVVAGPLAGAP